MSKKILFSTREAAQYLNLSIPSIKYHVYGVKDLEGQKLGNSLIFTKKQLDQFKKIKRSSGRPKE